MQKIQTCCYKACEYISNYKLYRYILSNDRVYLFLTFSPTILPIGKLSL